MSPPTSMAQAKDASADIIPISYGRREDKRAGEDGYFWPFFRTQMRDSAPIRARMVEDCRDILTWSGTGRPIITEDLLEKGWTSLQIAEHRDAAMVDLAASLAAQPLNRARQNPDVA